MTVTQLDLYAPIKRPGGQAGEILRFLEANCSLTPREAQQFFNCDRLAARIAELRLLGYRIATETLTTANGKHCARYRLVP